MEAIGYKGYYLGKCGLTTEGCALFVKSDRVEVVNSYDLAVKDFLSTDHTVFKVRWTSDDSLLYLSRGLGVDRCMSC